MLINYPFKTLYFQSRLNRAQVVEQLTNVTFLSDANYRKPDNNPRVFYGEISDQDFTLETIENANRLVAFSTGEIRGSENEIYIMIRLGAWQHQRIFLLFGMVLFVCILFLTQGFPKHHAIIPWNDYGLLPIDLAMWILMLATLSLCIFLYQKIKSFKNRLQSSIEFFNQSLDATPINKMAVPLLFQ